MIIMSERTRKNESEERGSEKSLVTQGNRGLASGTLAFFSGFAAVALFGTTALKVGPILHLNLVELSWLVAIPTLTGAFLRIPFSLMVDRWGKWTLFVQLLIGLAGMIGIIFTLNGIHTSPPMVTYYGLLLFGAIAGTSISTFSSGITYVSYFFPQRKQGTALGIFAGLGNTAPGIFTVILPYALVLLGLVYAYVAWAIFLALATVIYGLVSVNPPFLRYIKEGKSRDVAEALVRAEGLDVIPSNSLGSSLRSAARNGKVWALVFMYLTSFGGFEAMTEWLPTYWKGFLHVTPIEAGLLTGVVYSLLTALIRVFGGWSSDRLGGEVVSVFAFVIMIVGSLVFLSAGSLTSAIVAEIVMAIGMGIANGSVFKLVPRYSPDAVSGASGLVGGLGAAGGLLIPPIMGYIVSMSKYPYAFSIFTLLGLVSLTLAFALWRNKRGS